MSSPPREVQARCSAEYTKQCNMVQSSTAGFKTHGPGLQQVRPCMKRNEASCVCTPVVVRKNEKEAEWTMIHSGTHPQMISQASYTSPPQDPLTSGRVPLFANMFRSLNLEQFGAGACGKAEVCDRQPSRSLQTSPWRTLPAKLFGPSQES